MNSGDLMEHLKKINKTRAYTSKYGSDLIITATILGGLLSGYVYLYIKNNKKYIKKNWKNQRCNPMMIPFAGFIHSDETKDQFLFTNDNFSYCIRNILGGIVKGSLSPIKILTNQLTGSFNLNFLELEKLRGFFNLNLSNYGSFMGNLTLLFKNFGLVLTSVLGKIKNFIDKMILIIFL